jgi:uncharacterized repeat protein (TIGR02543 family)
VTEPEALTEVGCTFDGWQYNGAVWNFETDTVEADATLVAKWTINQYTITFDTDGGSAVDAITQDYNTSVTAPSDPTKTGYTFAGWDKTIPSAMPAENVTVKAKWTVNQYTITFNTDGGSAVDAITQDYNTAVTAPSDPTKTGYTFAGWDKTIPSAMPAEDMTITAEWYADMKYDSISFISFDAYGGMGNMADQSAGYGFSVYLRANAFTRTDYRFVGWNTMADGSGTSYEDEARFTVYGDITFYAQWTAKELNTISGTVVDNGKPAAGATVSLVQGEKTIAVTETAKDGTFGFSAPDGIYNIVIEKSGTTVTNLVSMETTQTVEIAMPTTGVSSTLNVCGDQTPDVMVGGLGELAEASGGATAVTMTVEVKLSDAASNASELQNAAIKQYPEQTLEFFDIKIEKTTSSTRVQITETGNVLEIIIPYTFKGRENVTVYRYHDGNAQVLTKADSKADGTYRTDMDNGFVYIYSSRFSTYAIGYTQCYNVSGPIKYGDFSGEVTVSLLDGSKASVQNCTVSLSGGSGMYSFTHIPKGKYYLTLKWNEDDEETILEREMVIR